jgi:hypothetical protein
MLRSRDKLFYTWIFRVPRQVVPLPFGLAWYGKGVPVLTVAWQRLRIKVQKGNGHDHVMIVMARPVRFQSKAWRMSRLFYRQVEEDHE